MTDPTNARIGRFAIMEAGMSGILPAIKSFEHAGQFTSGLRSEI